MAVENAGIIVSIGSAIGTFLAVLGFWTRFTDRIAKAQTIAENALQEAAEAKVESGQAREAFDAMMRDIHDRIDRMRNRREYGRDPPARHRARVLRARQFRASA